MSGWFYVSFAKGRFLGGAVVRARDLVEAVQEAHRLGINPGGQAIGAPVPSNLLPVEKYRERLLSKEDCEACWDDCVRLGDHLDEMDEDLIPLVGAECNVPEAKA